MNEIIAVEYYDQNDDIGAEDVTNIGDLAETVTSIDDLYQVQIDQVKFMEYKSTIECMKCDLSYNHVDELIAHIQKNHLIGSVSPMV